MNKWRMLISRRWREGALLLLFSILPFASSSVVLILVLRHQDFLQQLSPAGWALVFFILSIPIALSFIPNTIAGLLAGYFLGWAGLTGMTLSFSLACIWGFFLGKSAGGKFLDDVLELWPALQKYIARFRKKPAMLVSALRLLPAPPFAIGSLVLTWLHVPFPLYLRASIAGMLPRMALVVFIGAMARNLQELTQTENADYRLVAGMVLLGLTGIYLIYRFLRSPNESAQD
jgi:uncharacterized membrane protein YdjX (TVP38/TMEM64 family)